MPDFLLEIGLEEIPARMIDSAREELAKRIGEVLTRERLATAPTIRSFSTPRRIAVLASDISQGQSDLEEIINGPAVKVAFKDGLPTAAAEAFAKKVGRSVADLGRVTTPKGEYLTASVLNKGRSASEVLAAALPTEIAGLYWAKSMYWRSGKPERFVRPLRWIIALLGRDIVGFEFGGVRTGRTSRGHRIVSPHSIEIQSAADYCAVMERAKIIADPQIRRESIWSDVESAAAAHKLRVQRDDVLLSTVVNLSESPSVILGKFEREYLSLPKEVLVTVMRDHQRYFALEDGEGRLAPNFIAVLNMHVDNESAAIIRHGNERVLRARFNDARFFWDTDQKLTLSDRLALLNAVTFQKDLGSYGEKSLRMSKLVDWLAQRVKHVDGGAAGTAAQLAKCDLTCELVKEFTELQGIVGGLYASAQGHTDAVATAIYDQYKPLSSESEVPRTIEGALVAIADKADSIAGMFALGLIPSGSKDPFALRRAANGIVRILAEYKLSIPLSQLMDVALHTYDGSDATQQFKNRDYISAMKGFFRERLEFYLRESCGYAYDVVNAVLAVNADEVAESMLRVQAVTAVRKSDDFEAISLSFKRIKNILRQANEKNVRVAATLAHSALCEAEEKRLVNEAQAVAAAVSRFSEQHDYRSAVLEIAKIRPALDGFFDHVMVMADDEELRAQRLALLAWISREFSTIADFSEIVVEGK